MRTGKATIVVGAQFGDEGKGKFIDYLAEHFDIIARYNGGPNAGHTVEVEGETYKFHLMPSSVVRGKPGVIGNGVVVDPVILLEEIEAAKSAGLEVDLTISDAAHVIMPWHKWLDNAAEDAGVGVGSTRKGVGPAYAEKANRTAALRMSDLVSDIFPIKLKKALEQLEAQIPAYFNATKENGAFMDVFTQYKTANFDLKEYVGDTQKLLNEALEQGKKILFEGAQGTLLDVDHGTYPYVSSSNSTVGGACTGSGVSPTKINNVIGIAKAYLTRVGEGDFPTRMDEVTEDLIRKEGNEYGTTTHRPRDCGWLDLPALSYAHMINDFSELALTKLDVLGALDEIKVATSYTVKDTKSSSPLRPARTIEPVYAILEGWDHLSRDEWAEIATQGYDALPQATKEYITFIEDALKVDVTLISVGPGREHTIDRNVEFRGFDYNFSSSK
ncbi:MAG: adenylosuccinate synthase [Candidatus Altiarchaeota archaeon]|nr:adenylosuccinate synthase [Candidatus Altiarchaeota archaeon]